MDLNSMFEKAAQLSSTARQHVEQAYQGVNPDDADSRKSGMGKLKTSLTTFAAKAQEKGILNEAEVATLFQTATTFAQSLLLSRREARGSDDVLDEPTQKSSDGGTAAMDELVDDSPSMTNLGDDDDIGLAPDSDTTLGGES